MRIGFAHIEIHGVRLHACNYVGVVLVVHARIKSQEVRGLKSEEATDYTHPHQSGKMESRGGLIQRALNLSESRVSRPK